MSKIGIFVPTLISDHDALPTLSRAVFFFNFFLTKFSNATRAWEFCRIKLQHSLRKSWQNIAVWELGHEEYLSLALRNRPFLRDGDNRNTLWVGWGIVENPPPKTWELVPNKDDAGTQTRLYWRGRNKVHLGRCDETLGWNPTHLHFLFPSFFLLTRVINQCFFLGGQHPWMDILFSRGGGGRSRPAADCDSAQPFFHPPAELMQTRWRVEPVLPGPVSNFFGCLRLDLPSGVVKKVPGSHILSCEQKRNWTPWIFYHF